MSITHQMLNDLLSATLFSERPQKVSNLDPTLLRGYPAWRQLLNERRTSEKGGKEVRWPVNLRGEDNAVDFGPFGRVQYGVGDHLGECRMALKMVLQNTALDITEEAFNYGSKQIVNYLKNREQQALISMARKGERDFWNFAPITLPGRTQGFFYFFPYGTLPGTDKYGFVGIHPAGHTDVAALSAQTHEGHRSMYGEYSQITQDDLVRVWLNAKEYSNFDPPLEQMLVQDHNTGDDYGYYAPYPVIQEVGYQLRLQNDNLGPDFAAMHGKAMFQGVPLTKVPQLEEAPHTARQPICAINWGLWENCYMSGWWNRKIRRESAEMPTAIGINWVSIYQPICKDRRQGGFLLALPA